MSAAVSLSPSRPRLPDGNLVLHGSLKACGKMWTIESSGHAVIARLGAGGASMPKDTTAAIRAMLTPRVADVPFRLAALRTFLRKHAGREGADGFSRCFIHGAYLDASLVKASLDAVGAKGVDVSVRAFEVPGGKGIRIAGDTWQAIVCGLAGEHAASRLTPCFGATAKVPS